VWQEWHLHDLEQIEQKGTGRNYEFLLTKPLDVKGNEAGA
jgi:hypothetical protein